MSEPIIKSPGGHGFAITTAPCCMTCKHFHRDYDYSVGGNCEIRLVRTESHFHGAYIESQLHVHEYQFCKEWKTR